MTGQTLYIFTSVSILLAFRQLSKKHTHKLLIEIFLKRSDHIEKSRQVANQINLYLMETCQTLPKKKVFFTFAKLLTDHRIRFVQKIIPSFVV